MDEREEIELPLWGKVLGTTAVVMVIMSAGPLQPVASAIWNAVARIIANY